MQPSNVVYIYITHLTCCTYLHLNIYIYTFNQLYKYATKRGSPPDLSATRGGVKSDYYYYYDDDNNNNNHYYY